MLLRGVPQMFSQIRKRKFTLQGRLLLYFSALSVILFASMVSLLFWFGWLSSPQRSLGKILDDYLIGYERKLSEHISHTAAQGIHLATVLTDMIERTLDAKNCSFDAVSDNPELIRKLESKSVYLLKDALLRSRCSGSFIIFDATVNSSLRNSRESRCGVYLKASNITVSDPVSPQIFYLRGLPELALKHQFEFHNKWDLEYETAQLPDYAALLQSAADAPESRQFFLTKSFFIRGTSDKVMLLCVPLRGSKGTVYGLCGLEISDILYRLLYRMPQHDLPDMLMGFAQKSGHEAAATLHVGTGLMSGPLTNLFANSVAMTATDLKYYRRYQHGTLDFAGSERALRIAPLTLQGQDSQWVVAALLPWEKVQDFCLKRYIVIGLFLILFLGIALGASLLLTRRYATPVLQGIRTARTDGAATTNIQELDELIEVLEAKERSLLQQQAENARLIGHVQEQSELQADITAYRTFIEQISTLSKAERLVFALYIKGQKASEIAANLHLSINTIRTHNRNIYAKLNVSSYKELMVYIRMMTAEDRETFV